ncbi:MAG: DUF1289 domain-containing protein [Chromatiaceae bacterium]|nr:DUF1289 domain-containing protein [Chromatiaceae bacterium]
MNSGTAETTSPCIGVCRINGSTGLCRGCLRTLDEIAGWRDFSKAERQAVLAQLGDRRERCECGDL